MKELGTLRQLILKHSSETKRAKVFEYLFRKDYETIPNAKFEHTAASYDHVMDELLSKPHTTAYKMPILAKITTDDFIDPPLEYVDVCLLNTDYVAPPEGAEPWGCRKGEEPPVGHYNVNDEKYSKHFAFGFSSWSETIDTPVLDETGLEEHEVLAEVLWEMTFNGWTEKENDDKINDIKERCDKAMKEIESGNFIELSKLTENI